MAVDRRGHGGVRDFIEVCLGIRGHCERPDGSPKLDIPYRLERGDRQRDKRVSVERSTRSPWTASTADVTTANPEDKVIFCC